MLNKLLSPDVRKFIAEHENDDEQQLVLKGREIFGVPAAEIARQIASRRKAKEKLPLYYQSPNVIYPPPLNLEQSSSEVTAAFKSEITGSMNPGNQEGADLTGGFGVDSLFLSRLFERFHYTDPDGTLLEIARHNHMELGVTNIDYHQSTASAFLEKHHKKLDFVYIDPSRRKATRKISSFADSQPDLIALQSRIFEKTTNLLVKGAPLLDISAALKELRFVKMVYVVSVQNEVKELLFRCQYSWREEPVIEAVDIKAAMRESLKFRMSEESSIEVNHSDPEVFLYEPNASVLKAGAFKTISKQFGVKKIHANTHLYTTREQANEFPGRIFRIVAEVKSDRKMVADFFPDGKGNVIVRNYPLTADELKRKTGLRDGGEKYLIAFTGKTKKFLMACERLK